MKRSDVVRPSWLLAPIAGAAMLWVACSSFGGGTTPDAGDAADDAERRDVASTLDGGAPDAPDAPSFDAHVPIDGALIDDDFEVGKTCNGWSTVNSGTLVPVAVAGGGHTGARVCELCAFGGSDGMAKTVKTAPGTAGNYQAMAWIRAVDGGAPGAIIRFAATDADGGTTGGKDGFAAATPAWMRLQAVGTATAATTEVAVIIYVSGTTGCVHIDDVSLTKD